MPEQSTKEFDREKAVEVEKMLLGIKDSSKDEILSFLTDDSVQLVISYCRIETLPEALFYLIPQIAADRYRMQGYGSEEAVKRVKSWTQGKRSEAYEDSNIYANHFLNDYKERLAPFINKKGVVPSDISSDTTYNYQQ